MIATEQALIAALAELTAALDAIRQGDALAYTVAQVAAMTHLSQRTVRRLIATGVLARVQHVDRVLVARVELDRFLAERAA